MGTAGTKPAGDGGGEQGIRGAADAPMSAVAVYVPASGAKSGGQRPQERIAEGSRAQSGDLAVQEVDGGAPALDPKAIGNELIDRRVITLEQLELALAFLRSLAGRGRPYTLADLLHRFGFANPRVLQSALEDIGVQGGFAGAEADLQRLLANIRVTGFAFRFVQLKGGRLTIESAGPLTNRVRSILLKRVRDAGLQVNAIERMRSNAGDTLQLAAEAGAGSGNLFMRLRQMERDPNSVEQSLVSHLVTDLFVDALERRATDIHFNCAESEVESRIEYRVDRDLILAYPVGPSFLHRICAIVRERANIDTEDTRSAFDSRLTFDFQGREIEARISAGPQLGGQIVVARLNDPSSRRTVRDVYGAYPAILEEVERCCADAGRQGQVVMLSGAVNTGKSTALRAMLMDMPRHRRRILAIEDPVEQRIPFVVHKPVDSRPGGLGYVEHLRQALREDVDVVSVGEIRDFESLFYALRVPDAGNTLMSTVHADDAPSTLRRLMLLAPEGTSRQAVASILGLHIRLVVNQALITTVCDFCGERCEVRALPGYQRDVLGRFGMSGVQEVCRPSDGGCPRCEYRGYRGRVLLPDALIVAPHARATLAEALTDLGFFSQFQSGRFRSGVETDGLTWHRRSEFTAQMVRDGRVDAVTALPYLSRALEEEKQP